jgi:hypothetical protein
MSGRGDLRDNVRIERSRPLMYGRRYPRVMQASARDKRAEERGPIIVIRDAGAAPFVSDFLEEMHHRQKVWHLASGAPGTNRVESSAATDAAKRMRLSPA